MKPLLREVKVRFCIIMLLQRASSTVVMQDLCVPPSEAEGVGYLSHSNRLRLAEIYTDRQGDRNRQRRRLR